MDKLDDYLWRFKASSFIPHCHATSDATERVALGFEDAPGSHNDVLVNLALAPPSFFARFERVAEVVTQDEDSLQALRDAWRYYKDRGYPLTKHDLP